MKLLFKSHKDQLFLDLMSTDFHERFISSINGWHEEGYTKKEIYNLFLEFHEEIQVDNRTKNDEATYDNLSDFMDGFADHGLGFTILRNETF